MTTSPAKSLRYPFKVAASAGDYVVGKVNCGVDTSIGYSKKAVTGVTSK